MSNLFIFKYFNALQLLNIEAIFVTKCVLKFNKSKDVKELHSENISFILLTWEVLNLDKSKDVKDLHP